MINASKEFKQKLKSGANIVNYADVTLADGTVLHLTYKDFIVGGCSIEDKATDGKFGAGFCIGKTLTVKLANHDERFSQYDFYGATIHIYVALLLDDGTIEKIRKGIYYAMVPSTPGDIIEISAVDGMYRLDRDYSASTTIYPSTLQTILTEACLDCGIPIGFRQFDNMGFIVQERPEKATYRQVVSYAAQVAGYNARIDNAGYMQLVWYDAGLLDWNSYVGGNFRTYPHDTIIDGGDFSDYSTSMVVSGGLFTDESPEHVFRIKSLDIHTDDVRITGVRVAGDEDVSELCGEEGYVIEVKDNPFTAGSERAVADYLGSRMVGMAFRPFSAQVLGNPLYEPGDIVRISDRKGNVYSSLINSVSYTVGAYTQISCEAEDPLRNGSTYFSGAAAVAVATARKDAEKQISEYDKAVQQMNQLAMNAMGFHTTYEDMEDGSRIVYLHDKPELADSKTIYKQTIDGFFISTDGGKSYTAGFDSQGNVVVNILYAIGIVADWIRTGRFQVLKGSKVTFLADADTGEVRIVADSFALSSGDTIDSIAQDKADDALASAKTYADSASKGAVESQTQLDIFNKLTGNGAVQGIYLKDGKIYINGSYIQTGIISIKKGSQTTFLADANTGQVKIVADEFSLSSGQTIDTIAQGKVDSFVSAVYDPKIASLQSQIDGQIETWYYDYQPTLSNAPASSWKTEADRARHEGDLFYWKSKGYSYRFFKEGSTWKWQLITDSDITKALADAAAAQDTADHKRRVFVTTPAPPYDVGDLWFAGGSSDIMTCMTARAGGSYVASDWQKRNKYIDQAAANAAAKNAVDAQTQTDILNKLTNNGADQGIYLLNGRLYVSFSAARGGELTLGGANDASGVLNVLDKDGNLIGKWSKDGLFAENAYIKGNVVSTKTGDEEEFDAKLGLIKFPYVSQEGGVHVVEMETYGFAVNEGPALTKYGLRGTDIIDFQTTLGKASQAWFEVIMSNGGEKGSPYFTITYQNVSRTGDYLIQYEPSSDQGNTIKMDRANVMFNGNARGVYFQALGSSTSGNPLVATYTSAALGYRVLQSSSSSIRYKDKLRDMVPEDVEKLYGIQPVIAKYKDGILMDSDERRGICHPMFIAENVNEFFAEAVDHNADGEAENWNYRVMIPAMFQMIKSQKETMDGQQRKIEDMEARIERLEALLLKEGE